MIVDKLQALGKALGFNAVGISNIDLSVAEQRLLDWLAQGYHGDMAWMAHHGSKRSRPAELVPGTLSVISVRMDYFPPDSVDAEMLLNHPERAYISRYALGRDYHKVLRQRLEKFAQQLQAEIGSFGYRVFTDSAPVLEKPLAVKAGLGWMGKHTNILSREAGSWFFLGEIYTDLPLEETSSVSDHCGQCRACIDVCPTQAILAPYTLDARRCISYLTIEHQGSIPLELRPLLGNRIYGCDDCQLICPWNRFAQTSPEADFAVRNGLDSARLGELFQWRESDFMRKLEGSPIRRIGYERWLRNIAVALGNAPASDETLALLQKKQAEIVSVLVQEHIQWAVDQHKQGASS
ncbi:tRNA epoxyqueuosine(34) reductase QueG [Thiothrix litoralis]|uniref:Epoxyqueuosine reductase n=1 Tax=Thiothrix litoralis TaxID=2891210 RepID=A0ABX7WQU6_9GAMM|nr:tRNA epoxyqueuosine(34) reductase QueG [Thiothrix litoralis]QTR46254.1 tRNA epoxyqueuosine(34) reductase QueG [Thiothrix litoralis]